MGRDADPGKGVKRNSMSSMPVASSIPSPLRGVTTMSSFAPDMASCPSSRFTWALNAFAASVRAFDNARPRAIASSRSRSRSCSRECNCSGDASRSSTSIFARSRHWSTSASVGPQRCANSLRSWMRPLIESRLPVSPSASRERDRENTTSSISAPADSRRSANCS